MFSVEQHSWPKYLM